MAVLLVCPYTDNWGRETRREESSQEEDCHEPLWKLVLIPVK